MHMCVRTLIFAACLSSALGAGGAKADVLELGSGGSIIVLASDRPAGVPPAVVKRRQPLASDLNKAALDYSLSPALLEAVVWQESRWRSEAVSPKGAIGLAQLMPETARELGVDPQDPRANLRGGALYLRRQLDRFGNLDTALAAYNAGPARVIAAHGVPAIPETRNFVDAILERISQATP